MTDGHYMIQVEYGSNPRGSAVDSGVTSHIINDVTKFKKFDDSFQPETHCVELADGTRYRGVAERRGDADVCLIDNKGECHKATLKHTQYIPSSPQDICYHPSKGKAS